MNLGGCAGCVRPCQECDPRCGFCNRLLLPNRHSLYFCGSACQDAWHNEHESSHTIDDPELSRLVKQAIREDTP